MLGGLNEWANYGGYGAEYKGSMEISSGATKPTEHPSTSLQYVGTCLYLPCLDAGLKHGPLACLWEVRAYIKIPGGWLGA